MSRILTMAELQKLSLHELTALRGKFHRQYEHARPGSIDARIALENLHAVTALIRTRQNAVPKPPGM